MYTTRLFGFGILNYEICPFDNSIELHSARVGYSWPGQFAFPHLPMCHTNYLISGPNKGNREFCFPETLNVFRGEAGENIEVKGKQDSLFPAEPVIKCFVIPPN